MSGELLVTSIVIMFVTTTNVAILVVPRYLSTIGVVKSALLKKTVNLFIETWSSAAFESDKAAESSDSDEADDHENMPPSIEIDEGDLGPNTCENVGRTVS